MGKREETALAITKINAITNLIASIFVTTIKWGVVLGIAYFAYLSVEALAGKTTFAKIGLSLLGDIKISEAIAYVLGGGGIFYGWRQRQLRKKRIAELSEHSEGLEKLLDKRRTSSKLPPTGETRDEDKL